MTHEEQKVSELFTTHCADGGSIEKENILLAYALCKSQGVFPELVWHMENKRYLEARHMFFLSAIVSRTHFEPALLLIVRCLGFAMPRVLSWVTRRPRVKTKYPPKSEGLVFYLSRKQKAEI